MENKGLGWDSLTKEAFRQSRIEFPMMKLTTHVDALKFHSEMGCIFSGFYGCAAKVFLKPLPSSHAQNKRGIFFESFERCCWQMICEMCDMFL